MLSQFLTRLANIIIDSLLVLLTGLFVLGFCLVIRGSLMVLFSEISSISVIVKLFTATVYLIGIACFIFGLYKCRVYFFGNIKNPKFLKSFSGSARSRRQLIIAILLIFFGIFILLLPSMLISTSGPYG